MRPYKHILSSLAVILCVATATAQDKQLMADRQSKRCAALERAASAPTDNERYLASEEAVGWLSEALASEGSERWTWKLPASASVLTSPDKRFRIFSWAVVRDDGEYECFGAVQYYNEREEMFDYRLLHDRSYELLNREESLLSADRWLGAIYQDLIQTQAGDKTYYTLLGWNGVDNVTDMRVIEPVVIKGGEPQFGAPLFRRERNLRRVVLEYRGDAAVQMAYDEQTVQKTYRERVKKKGRYRVVERKEERKERMIIFDEVEPHIPGMVGLYQYYVQSGTELAYVWVDGKWELRQDVQGRLADKRLNKAFEPLQKSAPAFRYTPNGKQ